MADRDEVYTDAETAPMMYVNSVVITQSPFDLRLRLGVIQEATAERIQTKILATVFMSPQHAKVFATVLQAHIKRFENVYGPILLDTVTEPENQDATAADGARESAAEEIT